jgi:hypothetical protein
MKTLLFFLLISFVYSLSSMAKVNWPTASYDVPHVITKVADYSIQKACPTLYRTEDLEVDEIKEYFDQDEHIVFIRIKGRGYGPENIDYNIELELVNDDLYHSRHFDLEKFNALEGCH